MPRVSVIIPCFNREKLLVETLESLRAQTFPDWEGIVVDDGSSDASVAVAERFALGDPRFRSATRQGTGKGANVCRNQGLALAKGEFIIFLDSDDLVAPTCLSGRVESMDAAPECGFGVYQTELFADRIGDRKVLWNAFTDENDLRRFLSLDSVWCISGPVWRRRTITELGGFDEDLLSFQDWDTAVRALIAGVRYFKKPVRDHFYRHGVESVAAISTVSGTDARHLQSHERLFNNTLGLLKSAGLFDDEIRNRMAGLYWWLAKRWHSVSNLLEADRVWRRAWALGLCSRRQYAEGRVIFRLYRFRGGGRLAQIIQYFWPRQYYRLYSESWQNAPLAGV